MQLCEQRPERRVQYCSHSLFAMPIESMGLGNRLSCILMLAQKQKSW